jgi:hypothetical protein
MSPSIPLACTRPIGDRDRVGIEPNMAPPMNSAPRIAHAAPVHETAPEWRSRGGRGPQAMLPTSRAARSGPRLKCLGREPAADGAVAFVGDGLGQGSAPVV